MVEVERTLSRLFVGLRVGTEVGLLVGRGVGMRDGRKLGAFVGDCVGFKVGDLLGDTEIAFVVPRDRNFVCIFM